MRNKLYLYILLNLLFATNAGRDDGGGASAGGDRIATVCPMDSTRAKYFAFANLGGEHEYYKNVQLPGDTLSKSFVPDSLKQIPTTKLLRPNKPIEVCAPVITALTEMADAMYAEIKRTMIIASGYRSFKYQQGLYGDGSHAKSRAFPGTSQHQTGFALDLIGTDNTVNDRPEIKWLQARAWKYSFVNTDKIKTP